MLFDYSGITRFDFGGSRARTFASANRLDSGAMRIAKPILLVSTPVGVAFGLIEAWRVGAWLGTLMLVLLSALSGFAWLTVRRIRAERGAPSRQARP